VVFIYLLLVIEIVFVPSEDGTTKITGKLKNIYFLGKEFGSGENNPVGSRGILSPAPVKTYKNSYTGTGSFVTY
tara:strand:- start:644 stop:865 length:222 start_codon:yes stop_codon:yes gene_type:complete